ncbi:MAG: acetyl-CoA C-acetyltransferase [Anaerolineae bacterium]|nr:acetyl-CoA C-acetyltransferase [Anaerolineae bacterium]
MSSNGKSAHDVVILGAARTPQGRILGALESLSAVQLGQVAVKAAVERSGIQPEHVHEVILGHVITAGAGQATPRQVWIGLNYPNNVGGLSVNKICGSGLKAVMLAAGGIRAGDGEVYVVGGMESMSSAPHLDTNLRKGFKYGNVELKDAILQDGLWCSLENWVMGEAAEFIANQFEVSREEMDEFAYQSHQKAYAATQAGRFKTEIAPVELTSKKGVTVIDTDEPIRPETTIEGLAALKPAFHKDGRVTAGNAPGLNDGAAAMVISSRSYAEANGHTSIARIAGYGQAAVDPKWIFYAPVKAIPIALQKAGWKIDDVDLFEINEAFASQVLADMRGLEQDGFIVPMEKVNVNGGAIALGHPLGASGARVLVTLIHALQQRGLKRGVAALCLGGAEAVALAVELEN